MGKFIKLIEIDPGFDFRNPNPKKNYGIGSAYIRFVLKKDNKAVQAVFRTNWYPSTVEIETQDKLNSLFRKQYPKLECIELGYHSPHSIFDGQTESRTDCPYTKGSCYCDGSFLRGEKDNLAELLITEGDTAIWKYLKQEWKRIFG